MTTESGFTPRPAPFDPRDRRREPRVEFSNRCLISVQAPIWAITPNPLEGKTENITLNGLRVNALRVKPGQAQSWLQAIRDDQEVNVEVHLSEIPDFPSLRGRIVWIYEGDAVTVSDADEFTFCSVGILFSIMREKEKSALQDLLQELPSKF